MSVNGNMGADSYNEYEVSGFFADPQVNADSDGGEDAIKYEFKFDNIAPRGLDRGEVAEIVYMDAFVQFTVRDDGSDPNGELANGAMDYQACINEPAEISGGVETDTEVVSGSPSIPSTAAGQGSAPETLYEGNLVATAGFEAGADGVGGPGSGDAHQRYAVDFRELFGQGPIVDRFDDFRIISTVDGNNLVGKSKGEHRVRLYLNVMESDRAEGFGRP